MRKLFSTKVFWGGFIAIAVFFAFSMPARSGEKKYVLKFASEYFPKHPSIVNGIMPWLEDVKEKSGGRLVINYFAPGALTPQKEHYGAVVSGAVDIAFAPQAHTPGKFPLADVIALPLTFSTAGSGSLAAMEIYEKFPKFKEEYKDIKFLWLHVSAPFELHTTKKLVRTLDDLAGMKIIAWDPIARSRVKALGANPVEMTPNDTYLALERGMADGVLCPLAPIRAKKISDAAKYHTLIGLYVNPFWGGMNRKKYDQLPEDLKKILDDMTGVELTRIFGKTLDDGAAKDSVAFKKEGHEFYSLPPAEKERWIAKVQGIHDAWVKEMKEKGYKNAGEMRETAIRLGKELAQ